MPRRKALLALGAAGLAGAARAAAGPDSREEPALEPNLPIIDPHHHLRDYRDGANPRPRYRINTLLADIDRSGHKVTRTVFVECAIMYRPDGPPELASLGETDYVRAAADQNDRDHPDGCRVAAGTVCKVDLKIGERAREVLQDHIAAAGGRLRGVRNSIAWDAYPPLASMGPDKDLFSNPDFKLGVAQLEPLGLSLDVWLFHPQIGELTALARTFPQTTFILDHQGHILGIGPYAGHGDEVYATWKQAMKDLATCPNVIVKLGGQGPFSAPPPARRGVGASTQLAADWKRGVLTSIELFGVKRCMFESNYPANARISSYGAGWNAFKRITAGFSPADKAWLYSDTARTVYRLA